MDELGAHVSASGGVHLSPGRAREIEASVLQLFTKQPSRWAESVIDAETADAFKKKRAEHGITVAGAHDSYLINLSSPDRRLWRMSQRSFESELDRCALLELDFLVTHPGNATDGDPESGLERNARGITESLEAVEGGTRVLLELTAGSGTTVGATFENLQTILELIPMEQRHRVGICFDTCHAYSAGYDLVDDYEGVWANFDDVIGLERLALIHMNDSQHPFDSRKDRHEAIGEGSLGLEPFRRIVLDERLVNVPKVLETPKGDEGAEADIRNLDVLRSLRAEG
ncbi:MAG TPA: deoxyribonuclease IV [Gemmatimonadetes bacterium]|jgi:deoxyribonuclease-4|nr:deoxyribonuclease IV [Gemmatimonadaceae bacterium]HAY77333.1 deoxyribonuclease IV [Gemmatimonadota bacterium]|tara:strand:+ start:711 stop:1565 length:855 start_codon:yes stop_codon:yes gene_type:complete